MPDEWLRDPVTGGIAVCEVQEIDVFEDITRTPFSDRTRAEKYAATVIRSDEELVAVFIVDY